MTTQKKISDGQFKNAKLSVDVTSIPVDTKGDFHNIHHSNSMDAISYDAARKIMAIKFKLRPASKGGPVYIYEFEGIEPEFWENFIKDETPFRNNRDSLFASGKKYKYKKITSM